jgi:hypothetical protein
MCHCLFDTGIRDSKQVFLEKLLLNP